MNWKQPSLLSIGRFPLESHYHKRFVMRFQFLDNNSNSLPFAHVMQVKARSLESK